jgi:antitoxin (DNA-binding transcriptional repressor) of toxin-antitoxin stability system
MKTIGVRELQQHASAALRRVASGETLGVTVRGHIVAVLSSPSNTAGVAALTVAGRVQPARRHTTDLPQAVKAKRPTSQVLDELREDR